MGNVSNVFQKLREKKRRKKKQGSCKTRHPNKEGSPEKSGTKGRRDLEDIPNANAQRQPTSNMLSAYLEWKQMPLKVLAHFR